MDYSKSANFYYKMADGTCKQVNPFTGREVWNIPGRNKKPTYNSFKEKPVELQPLTLPEKHCNFCAANYLSTPPEKARLLCDPRNGAYIVHRPDPSRVFSGEISEFRRIPNLFEIVTIDFWKKNYNYRLSKENLQWKTRYLVSEQGKQHLEAILRLKLKLSGITENVSAAVLSEMSDAFFGGGHELIVAKKHYRENATRTDELCASGNLTPDDHYRYIWCTVEALQDIYRQNKHVRYVTVFQNWLKDAGASFDHLHKQLVALDEWGVSVSQELNVVAQNPNIYNEACINFAIHNDLVLAENEFAIAIVDLGHAYPTIGIYSKAIKCRPEDHEYEETRGFSDMLHAMHAATGTAIATNEEWYYTPRDSVVAMPWHVLLKWRVNTPAGFEGGTKMFINPLTLQDLRDLVVPKLIELKEANQIERTVRVYEECTTEFNPLKYIYQKKSFLKDY